MFRHILIYLCPAIIVMGVVFFSLISSIELNPLSIPYKGSRLIFTIVPQGWGFFTRDPRENQTLVYRKRGDEFELVNKSGTEPEYLFGLSRVSRRQNIELGQIMGQITDSMWVDCPSKNLAQCEPVKAHRFKNSYQDPLCKGEFVVVLKEPVPWAWSKSYYKIEMPFKLCKIYVD
jgi:antimicrobial peptide system SdpA family protein